MKNTIVQVGVLSRRIIDLLELTLPEGQGIFLGESNIEHMNKRHPRDYELYGKYISVILSEPDYVRQSPEDGSLE